MSNRGRLGTPDPRHSHTAPEPEGPEEVYRRFERLNRRGRAGSLRELAGGAGKKLLYGAFAAVEIAAIVLGFLLDVPYLDTVAIILPGLLVLFHGGSEGEETERPDETEGEPTVEKEREKTPVETFLERLLRRFGGPDTPGGGPR